jgi:uncharacterized protein YaaN involved in tellurite resistance
VGVLLVPDLGTFKLIKSVFSCLEEYDSELERMNVAMSAENQGLQHDNKQLNALIKEYEQTLETLMTTFRNRAVSFCLRRFHP